MAFSTFGHVRLPCCIIFATFWHFNLSFVWYLLHFGTSSVHVGFLRVLESLFKFLFRVSFKVSLGFHLRFH